MAENSAIEWTDHTFNPWTGCTRVGPGCDNCYAESWSKRAGDRVGKWGPGAQRVRTTEANWSLPVKWNRQAAVAQAGWAEGVKLYGSEAAALAAGNIKPRRPRVFCASLADVFDNEVPPAWQADLLNLIADTPHLDWLLLTKRIGNARAMLDAFCESEGHKGERWDGWPNVWLGATVVNQAEADRDVPKLLAVPARVHFLSIEPMLGRIDLERPMPGPDLAQGGGSAICQPWLIQSGIDWIVCGGESGPKARPMHPDWARILRDQCATAGVPFLFKQWGEWAEQDGDKPTRQVSMDTDVGETLAARCDGFISLAGEFVRDMDDAATDDPYRGLVRIGKKAAGRLLDGVEHNGFPEATDA